MSNRKCSPTQECEQFLEEIGRRWPLAKGSLAEVRKPCIRPRCAACARGEKHPAFIFAFAEKGRRRCMYVPRELVPRLRQAIENGRWVEEQLHRMGSRLIEAHRQNRRKSLVPSEGSTT
jgi:hypothetical protein